VRGPRSEPGARRVIEARRAPLRSLALAAGAGYLAGTLPSAAMAARMATGGAIDLRVAGSANPGAANAIAVLGSGWGYAVLAADIGKGAGACWYGRRVAGGHGAHLAGAAAVVGHCFPVWSGFRGGKGVAASVGQCLVTFPVWFPVDLAVALATASRRVRHRAFAATAVSSLAWVVGGAVWWRRKLPNLWGPEPTWALPAASAASAAVIMYKFAAAEAGR